MRPLVVVAFGRDEFFKTEQVSYAVAGQRFRHAVAICHGHKAFDTRHLCRKHLDERRKGEVEEYVLIVGVTGNVDELLREQARVNGVHHRTHSGDAVVKLEVAIGVPGERADALTF